MSSNHDVEDILPHVFNWQADGHRVVLASVLQTWGSSPRPVGSLMVVRDDGLFEGSVSGGCVEGAVIQSALEHMNAHTSMVLSFDVTVETAWRVGLACGGRIDVLLWPSISKDIWSSLTVEVDARRAPALLLDLQTQEVSLEDPESLESRLGEVVHRKQSGRVRGHEIVLQHFTPKPRLFITGAVHIAQALAPMATQTGYDVVIVDPRSAFTQAARFDEGTQVLTCWPQSLHEHIELDRQSAMVCLSHDPKIDDPALSLGLDAGAFYIGALGSRRSHAARLERLLQQGYTQETLARICGPVGLDIGAVSAAEIAVSILSELVQLWRSRHQLT